MSSCRKSQREQLKTGLLKDCYHWYRQSNCNNVLQRQVFLFFFFFYTVDFSIFTHKRLYTVNTFFYPDPPPTHSPHFSLVVHIFIKKKKKEYKNAELKSWMEIKNNSHSILPMSNCVSFWYHSSVIYICCIQMFTQMNPYSGLYFTLYIIICLG